MEHLSDAVRTAGRLGEIADQLIEYFVDEARRSGASWTEIGRHIGVSKQAAHKRFVPGDSDDLDVLGTGRLSHFTPRARNAVREARAEAQNRGADHVANEHVILGLLSEPHGLAAKAIVAAGVIRRSAQGGHARRAPDCYCAWASPASGEEGWLLPQPGVESRVAQHRPHRSQ